MHLDAAALLGYTGAVFAKFFAGNLGACLAAGMLLFWIVAPVAAGARWFMRKDF
jgi:Cu-processing system permease protein